MSICSTGSPLTLKRIWFDPESDDVKVSHDVVSQLTTRGSRDQSPDEAERNLREHSGNDVLSVTVCFFFVGGLIG